MARVVNEKQEKQEKQKPVKEKKDKQLSKKTILVFRVGMGIFLVALVFFAIFFTVKYFMNKQDEEDGPYDDYYVITVADVVEIISPGGLESFVDRKEIYKALRDSDSANGIYFYFFRSSELNETYESIIKGYDETKFLKLPFFFIDLDDEANAEVFTNSALEDMKISGFTEKNDFIVINWPEEDDKFETTAHNTKMTNILEKKINDLIEGL